MKKFFKKIISPLLEGINQQKETSSHTDRKKEKVILLETKEEMNIVKFDDILFAEINGRVITVFLTGNRSITGIRMRFEDFIRYVNSSDFIRCHKSYAVNVRKIETIRKIDYRSADIIFKDDAADGEVPAAGKAKCIISKTYHDEVLEAVQSRG